MHKNNKTSGRSFGAFRWSVIALAVGLAVCLSVHAQRTATATATVVKGFVVAITVTDGGSGYPVPPLVSISGGGGSGAGAEASVSGGVVVAIAVTATGRGYTSVPDVVIAAPPPPEAPVLKSVRLASAITIEGSLGTTNWILWADVLDTCPYTWRVLTNVVVTTSPYVVMDWEATPQQRFYQASSGPQPQVFAPDSNRWVWIPAGTFTMGSPASEQDRDSDEGPQTQVTISRGFWLGRHEVTQAEYQAVIGSNPSYFTGDANRPVERVTWYDATNYCAKLTEQERKAGRLPCDFVYRLPTEAEWECACRAGTTTRFYYGDDPGYTQLGDYAWYSSNSGSQTHPVGQKLPNPWGLYDTSGNVWEWCLDWYAGSLSGGSVNDPKGPGSGSSRVVRGGSWRDDGSDCRSAPRGYYAPGFRGYGNVGFRAVLAAGQP